jgi:hypothetical protein
MTRKMVTWDQQFLFFITEFDITEIDITEFEITEFRYDRVRSN